MQKLLLASTLLALAGPLLGQSEIVAPPVLEVWPVDVSSGFYSIRFSRSASSLSRELFVRSCDYVDNLLRSAVDLPGSVDPSRAQALHQIVGQNAAVPQILGRPLLPGQVRRTHVLAEIRESGWRKATGFASDYFGASSATDWRETDENNIFIRQEFEGGEIQEASKSASNPDGIWGTDCFGDIKAKLIICQIVLNKLRTNSARGVIRGSLKLDDLGVFERPNFYYLPQVAFLVGGEVVVHGSYSDAFVENMTLEWMDFSNKPHSKWNLTWSPGVRLPSFIEVDYAPGGEEVVRELRAYTEFFEGEIPEGVWDLSIDSVYRMNDDRFAVGASYDAGPGAEPMSDAELIARSEGLAGDLRPSPYGSSGRDDIALVSDESSPTVKAEELDKERKPADSPFFVLVMGGGMASILVAYFLFGRRSAS